MLANDVLPYIGYGPSLFSLLAIPAFASPGFLLAYIGSLLLNRIQPGSRGRMCARMLNTAALILVLLALPAGWYYRQGDTARYATATALADVMAQGSQPGVRLQVTVPGPEFLILEAFRGDNKIASCELTFSDIKRIEAGVKDGHLGQNETFNKLIASSGK